MSKIEAEISLDTREFTAATQRVQGSLARLESQMSVLSSGIARMAGSFALPAAALTAIGGAAVVAFRDTYALAGRLDDLSMQTGLAAGQALVLERAFQMSGIAADRLAPSIAKLNGSLIAALQDPESDAAAALKRLGLSAQDLLKLNAEGQIRSLTDAFGGLASQAEKLATATELFGKQGYKMVTLLSDPGAISAARAQAGELEALMDREAAAMAKTGDAAESLWLKLMQLKVGFADEIGGRAGQMVNALSELDFTSLGRKFARPWEALPGANMAYLTAKPIELAWKAMNGKLGSANFVPPTPALLGGDQEAINRLMAEGEAGKKEKKSSGPDQFAAAMEKLGSFLLGRRIDAATTPDARAKVVLDDVGVKTHSALLAEIASTSKALKPDDEKGAARLEALMAASGRLDQFRREAVRDGQQAADDKQREIDALTGENMPRMQVWASSARQLGLGGNAADNSDLIAKVQAERLRGIEGLMRELVNLQKRIPVPGAGGELVFN